MILERVVHWWKSLKVNDPFYSCLVHTKEGCCHVDGLLCDFPDCEILSDYLEEEGSDE